MNLLHVMLLYNSRTFAAPLFEMAFHFVYSQPHKVLALMEVTLAMMQPKAICKVVDEVI